MSCTNKPATTSTLLGMHFRKLEQFFKEPFRSENLQVLENVRNALFFAVILTFVKKERFLSTKRTLYALYSKFAAFFRLLNVNYVPKDVYFIRIGRILQGH